MTYPDDEYAEFDEGEHIIFLAAADDDRASDVDVYTRRVSDVAEYALARRGGATWAEWADPFGMGDLATEPTFPAWLDDLPGLSAGPAAIAEYLAAAPLSLDPAEHARLRALLKRVDVALGAVGPVERYWIEGSRERLAFSLVALGFRLAALEAVHYDELPADAFHLRDEEFELLYGARAEYDREVTEAVFERFLRDLEGEARHLIREADELLREADDHRAAAAAADTPEEAAEYRALADAAEAAGQSRCRAGHAISGAVDWFRAAHRRARRARHRPPPRRRPTRCTLRGSPATVTRCPAAPHGPPTRAPRVRYAVPATA